MTESHDRNCASRWNASSECDCGADRVNAEQAIHTLESVNRSLEARIAELEGAMGNLLLAAEHVSVFVNSRERIQSTTGKTWYEDQLAIARSALNR